MIGLQQALKCYAAQNRLWQAGSNLKLAIWRGAAKSLGQPTATSKHIAEDEAGGSGSSAGSYWHIFLHLRYLSYSEHGLNGFQKKLLLKLVSSAYVFHYLTKVAEQHR